ncbi:hypothetical protein BDR22DRAFT_824444 [Usnea florida]
MPRTVWKQANPHLQGNPQWDNPTYLRGCAEEAHFEPQRKAFHIPLYIRPEDSTPPTSNASPSSTSIQHPITPTTKRTMTAASYRLDFRNHFNKHSSRLLADLTPDDCRAFCWKDCAIYGSSPHLTGKDHMALLDEIYREWYPHRAEDKDVSEGSFFGKFMRFVSPTSDKSVGVGDVAHFHSLLCGRLKDMEGHINREAPVDPCAVKRFNSSNEEMVQKVAEYKLRETFEKVFIVIDNTTWQQRGVLLVWASESDAERHNRSISTNQDENGNGDGDGQKVPIRREWSDDGNDDTKALDAEMCMLRCPLKRALQIAVSTDPQRAGRRREWNEMLEEILGEG